MHCILYRFSKETVEPLRTTREVHRTQHVAVMWSSTPVSVIVIPLDLHWPNLWPFCYNINVENIRENLPCLKKKSNNIICIVNTMFGWHKHWGQQFLRSNALFYKRHKHGTSGCSIQRCLENCISKIAVSFPLDVCHILSSSTREGRRFHIYFPGNVWAA